MIDIREHGGIYGGKKSGGGSVDPGVIGILKSSTGFVVDSNIKKGAPAEIRVSHKVIEDRIEEDNKEALDFICDGLTVGDFVNKVTDSSSKFREDGAFVYIDGKGRYQIDMANKKIKKVADQDLGLGRADYYRVMGDNDEFIARKGYSFYHFDDSSGKFEEASIDVNFDENAGGRIFCGFEGITILKGKGKNLSRTDVSGLKDPGAVPIKDGLKEREAYVFSEEGPSGAGVYKVDESGNISKDSDFTKVNQISESKRIAFGGKLLTKATLANGAVGIRLTESVSDQYITIFSKKTFRVINVSNIARALVSDISVPYDASVIQNAYKLNENHIVFSVKVRLGGSSTGDYTANVIMRVEEEYGFAEVIMVAPVGKIVEKDNNVTHIFFDYKVKHNRQASTRRYTAFQDTYTLKGTSNMGDVVGGIEGFFTQNKSRSDRSSEEYPVFSDEKMTYGQFFPYAPK